MTLSERVKLASLRDYPKAKGETYFVDGLTNGRKEESDRLRPLIEALAEVVEVMEYATGPTRDVKTPKMILALTRLEAVLSGMEEL